MCGYLISKLERNRRSGLTLVEVLLVLAIIIMVAAFALPQLTGTFDAQRLSRAADMVRSEWTRARVEAIRSGQEWAFFYVPGTGNYGISPYSPYATPNLPVGSAQDDRGTFDYGRGQLPRGVMFNQAIVTEDTRSMAINEENSGSSGSGGTKTILFYPDGTTQQTELMLTNERNWIVTLNLRALTGTTTISEVNSNPTNR